MKKGLILIGALMIFCGMLGSCDSSSSSGTKYSGYSNTYKNDSGYRENVRDIADAYGISEKEVDTKINAITGGK